MTLIVPCFVSSCLDARLHAAQLPACSALSTALRLIGLLAPCGAGHHAPVTGITLNTAQAQLDIWILAETKVASGQADHIGQRSFKRAALSMNPERIRYSNAKVLELSRNGPRQGIGLSFAVPID